MLFFAIILSVGSIGAVTGTIEQVHTIVLHEWPIVAMLIGAGERHGVCEPPITHAPDPVPVDHSGPSIVTAVIHDSFRAQLCALTP